jgi:glycosyltransferase involved in cell wall biosynthesis
MTKRVLYLAWAPFFSGAERALLLTLQALDPSRYEPFVLAGTDGEFATQVRALGIPCHVVPLRQLDRQRPFASLASVTAVFRWAVRYRVSIVHSNDMPSFQPGGYVARALGIPSITHVRFPDKAEGYRWFFKPGFSRALFVSHDLMAGAIEAAPDVFEGRSDVLHDWVQPQAAWSTQQIAACRDEIGVPREATIVALTGQIAEVKGVWDFVEAARLLARRDVPVHFAVLGDDLKNGGKKRLAMETRVAALGLGDRFTFLGFRADAPRIVQAFDVIAVPSHVEPLGNATLEAMAAGVPVVGSRVGGIPEMVVDGETGVLAPPSAPQALADAIERVVQNRSLRAAMSQAARRRASEAFGRQVHGKRLQGCYDSLLAGSNHVSQENVA